MVPCFHTDRYYSFLPTELWDSYTASPKGAATLLPYDVQGRGRPALASALGYKLIWMR
jgi:hypothetical protein